MIPTRLGITRDNERDHRPGSRAQGCRARRNPQILEIYRGWRVDVPVQRHRGTRLDVGGIILASRKVLQAAATAAVEFGHRAGPAAGRIQGTCWSRAITGVTKPMPTSEMLWAGAVGPGAELGVSIALPLKGATAVTLGGRFPSGFVFVYAAAPGLPE